MNKLNAVATENGQINFAYKVPQVKTPTEEEIIAFLEKAKICNRCGGSKWIAGSYCRNCQDEIKLENQQEKKRLWLEEREKETLEGRIKFIEEWVYNHMYNHPERQTVMR